MKPLFGRAGLTGSADGSAQRSGGGPGHFLGGEAGMRGQFAILSRSNSGLTSWKSPLVTADTAQ